MNLKENSAHHWRRFRDRQDYGTHLSGKEVAHLVIWDVNPDNIRRTEIELAGILGSDTKKPNADTRATMVGHKNRIHSYQVNCADADIVAETYSRVISEVGDVDMLINCAGIVRGNNTFDKQTVKDIDLTMDVNATAPMLVALQALPDMIKRDSGCICNIASAAGMLGVPKMSVYCASKWAVIGWTESMRIELKLAKSKVKVLSVAPYFINTGMFDGVQSKIFPILKPEKVAAKVIRAIEKGKTSRESRSRTTSSGYGKEYYRSRSSTSYSENASGFTA